MNNKGIRLVGMCFLEYASFVYGMISHPRKQPKRRMDDGQTNPIEKFIVHSGQFPEAREDYVFLLTDADSNFLIPHPRANAIRVLGWPAIKYILRFRFSSMFNLRVS